MIWLKLSVLSFRECKIVYASSVIEIVFVDIRVCMCMHFKNISVQKEEVPRTKKNGYYFSSQQQQAIQEYQQGYPCRNQTIKAIIFNDFKLNKHQKERE